MSEERIVETHTPSGDTHTHTTVIRDDAPSSGGGSFKWVVLLLVIIAAIVGIYLFSQGNGAEIARDNAIGDAAEQVGNAAQQVGNAAEDVADNVSGGE